MGQQIIKQPNGLYAVWSTIVDDFVLYDCTPEDIIQDRMSSYERTTREDVQRIIGQLKRREKPYYQFTETWASCLSYLRKYHPDSDTFEHIERLDSKEEAKRRLKEAKKNRGYYMWLHVPSGRAIPEKPEDAPEDEWRRITVWIQVEDEE